MIKFAIWLIVGALAGFAHLYHLRNLVMKLDPADEQTPKKLTRFAPLRILLFMPLLLGAAYAGLPACLGFVLGMIGGRGAGALLLQSTTSLD